MEAQLIKQLSPVLHTNLGVSRRFHFDGALCTFLLKFGQWWVLFLVDVVDLRQVEAIDFSSSTSDLDYHESLPHCDYIINHSNSDQQLKKCNPSIKPSPQTIHPALTKMKLYFNKNKKLTKIIRHKNHYNDLGIKGEYDQHLQPCALGFQEFCAFLVRVTGFIIYFQCAELLVLPSFVAYQFGFWARFSSTRLQATLRNSELILLEFFADTQMQFNPFFQVNCSIYFLSTSLGRSILLPTTQISPSCPLVSLTKSCHLSMPQKVLLQLTSMTMRQQSASRTYEGINDLNLSCPAVSQSWSRIVSPSIWRVLVTKSMPTVGWVIEMRYVGSLLEGIVDESRYY